ncbi:hypothetical protein [Dictyobacter kobayashii]|uniref:Uncharacterized protein n=1 Tax=Dictyobacter kobayashii TaxID=2014872 RepID=A0A402AIU4_9CHLR|nr:hypothetical protein [Dictyobacter kobayashii]GCE18975.1 hypothetical protein KDK_27750 [Dictyobacter kobayashii]
MTESIVWHQEKKTQHWTEYYLLLANGEQRISLILKHNAETNEVIAEPYSPPDINYTIHDSCDHEQDECVLDDPDSWESQDVAMAEQYGYAEKNLVNLERQVKEQKIVEQLIAKKQRGENNEL